MKRWVASEQLLITAIARAEKVANKPLHQERFRICTWGSFLISWPKFLGHRKILPRWTSKSSLEMFLSQSKQNSFSTLLPKGKNINHYMISQVHCRPSLLIPLTSFHTRNILDSRRQKLQYIESHNFTLILSK